MVTPDGQCIYASTALARLLQCGIPELLGDGWRVRLSPFADRPFDFDRALVCAAKNIALRHRHPHGTSEIVSRIKALTDPNDPTKVVGFFGRVHIVRIMARAVRAAMFVAVVAQVVAG